MDDDDEGGKTRNGGEERRGGTNKNAGEKTTFVSRAEETRESRESERDDGERAPPRVDGIRELARASSRGREGESETGFSM
jgi:hypothetical protein